MAADEEIAGHEIAGIDVPASQILPPTSDPADTCDAYAEIEYAGECVPDEDDIYPGFPDAFAIEGDTCDAYAEIEYAGECVSEDAIFPSLPGSSVEEFDTSRGRLGCGTPLVFITSRCSASMACQIELRDITKLIWTRRLSEVSEAEVEIGLTGDSTQTCCQCLAEVEPFCHELHIWRDGEEVWVGPIEAIRYERERVTIKARDSLAWLDVRIPNEDIEFKTTLTGNISPAINDVTTTIVSAAFPGLPTVTLSAPTVYVMLDPFSEFPEVVLVTNHAAASTTITVIRGQQGTLARSHDNFAIWAWGGLSGPETDITYIAKFIIDSAFEEDVIAGNTCEVDSLYAIDTGTDISWFSEGFNQTSLEVLSELAETQLNFTVIGRTIVLTDATDPLTPLALLNDEHIMGEIEVTKDGKLMGNRQWVHFDGDGGIPELAEADRFCYSLIERIIDINEIQVEADAQAQAQALVDATYIAPRIVEIPAGSRLSPDTPWTMNQMVPGARVNVAVTRLCLSLTSSFQLVGVSVEYSASEGEEVGIELTPINQGFEEPF